MRCSAPIRNKASGHLGFGLLESIVGAAIMTVVLLGLGQVGLFTSELVREASLKLLASFLAEEGIEAVRIMRDTSWSENITPLALDTDHHLVFAVTWTLVPSSGPLIDGIFDRRIRFSSVYRDGADAITSSGGALDPHTKKVSAIVSWKQRGRTSTTTVSTYLTNFFSN